MFGNNVMPSTQSLSSKVSIYWMFILMLLMIPHPLVVNAQVSLKASSTSLAPNSMDQKLTLITYSDWPYASMEQGKPQGLLIDVVLELFRRAQIDFDFRFYPLKRGMLTVKKRPFHCVFPVDRNQEREAFYTWVSPIQISRYGLFSGPTLTVPLTTLNDAKALSIGSFLGTGIGDYLSELGFQVELTALGEHNLNKLVRQRIDLWASEMVSATRLMEKHKVDLGEPELVFFTSVRALACSDDLPTEYIDRLQLALTAMYRDGFMSELYGKYGVEF